MIKPGLYPHMSDDDYHGDTSAVSNSGLGMVAHCPRMFYEHKLSPNPIPEKARAGQLEGRLFHCAAFEPDEFDNRYVCAPENAPRKPSVTQRNAKKPSKDTLAAIAWWDEWTEQTAGKQIISGAQRAVALRQAASVHRLSPVREAIDNSGLSEASAFWMDEEHQVLCKCRPDYAYSVSESSAILLDGKTYSSARPEDVQQQIARKSYHCQDGMYSDGWSQVRKVDVLAFLFVFVETEAPYLASICELDKRSRAQGYLTYRERLATYANCKHTGVWPGYGDGIHEIELPPWKFDYERL